MDGDKKVVLYATLNKLVECLTSERLSDMLNFRRVFFMTYQSFTTTEKLLLKLIQRYSSRLQDKEIAHNIQIRVALTIKYWLENHGNDLNDKMIATINSFIDNKLTRDGHSNVVKQLRNVLRKGKETKKNSDIHRVAPEPRVPPNIFLTSLTLDSVHDEEVARQLTLLDYDIYQAIKPTELLSKNWLLEESRYLAPNIGIMIKRFNDVSRWVATTILKTSQVKQRTKVLLRFLKIAEYLKQMNSLNTLMAFYCGLINSAVSRLKFTFRELRDQASKKIFDDLERLFSPKNSYKNYKIYMANSKNPIPYFGIHLREILLIEEGLPSQIQRMINFSKRVALVTVITDFLKYQVVSPNFLKVPQICAFLKDFEGLMDDTAMYKRSLAIEPKDATLESIE
eukprot:TRINITY_DN4237_c0_g1_i1.p1 TRINITY_DN4237_c0_g1~~TRINITY_DN4237_c0_g1_i1.p1  ORF type:complete len:396 (-),score=88.60 TRINITY_DN4237_c0_g1_i1:844-2031(-)